MNMTNTDNITDDKKVDNQGLDDMKAGSYLKERLAHSSKSPSDTSGKKEHLHSSEAVQSSLNDTQKSGEDQSGQVADKNVSDKGGSSGDEEVSETNTKGVVLEPTISTLVLSLSSAALMALGLATDPSQSDKELKVDKPMAKFNIDMLIMLKEKTKGNLNSHEQKLLDAIISDLQIRYVEVH